MTEKISTASQGHEDPFKKEIQKQLEIAKKGMSRGWGIEELTNIELFHLRKITEDCVKQWAEEEVLQREGKFKDAWRNRIQLPHEIMLRWLHELYGISKNELDIHSSNVVWDMDGNIMHEFDQEDDMGPEKKFEELKAKGHHNVGHLFVPSSQFKEYIRRLRHKAHMP